MQPMIHRLYRDIAGSTLIEYGLIALLVALLAFGGLSLLGGGLSSSLTTTAGSIP